MKPKRDSRSRLFTDYWVSVVRRVNRAHAFRARALTVSGLTTVIVTVVGAYAVEMFSSDLESWRKGMWTWIISGAAVWAVLFIMMRRYYRAGGAARMFGGMEQIAPRNPQSVKDDLTAEAEGILADEVHTHGDIQLLRKDVWALSGGWYTSRRDAAQELLDDLNGIPDVGAADELTAAVDIEEAKVLARETLAMMATVDQSGNVWLPGLTPRSWIRVTRNGRVSRGKPPRGRSPFSPPDVPDLTIVGDGDSAGLSLFLAYVASMLKVAEDERFAVAATGDMVGRRFDAIGALEDKTRAASMAGACAVFLPDDQSVTMQAAVRMTHLTLVPDAETAVKAFLDVRAALEFRA